ncbi:Alpha/Beta hydrolase protein [Kickxella alabastrina]|uniref:Alpha/Beta hydrolase protein n=1 Tax=Kickxella alabastrina TaxID=61397 RepID=UPI00221F195A|nr:Alpha/Beta hydrolase protein [Kickxella alabastrina]KAI7834853.1 Alpha/Beta hydrolase protein [Kickxella alabastrina]
MDWIADFLFAAVPWPSSVNGSMVHTRFLGAYKGAAENIKAAVDNLVQKYPDYKIVLTGHSLGGAEAALAAGDFAIKHPEWISKIEAYTYGAPRVGNTVFSNWLSSQPFLIFRVNQSDVVSQVPLGVLGYQHHAQEVWYNTNDQLNFCGSNGEGAPGQNSLTALQMWFLTYLQYPGLGYEVWYLFVDSLKVIF